MDEEIPYSLENGMSRQEHKWLSDRFTDRDKNQCEQIKILQEQKKILRTINTTIQIVAVIVLVIAVLVALQILGL
jgi:predicted nucleic acid-binding Zn ribbon protein